MLILKEYYYITRTIEEINSEIVELELSIVHIDDGSLTKELTLFNLPILTKIEVLQQERLEVFNKINYDK